MAFIIDRNIGHPKVKSLEETIADQAAQLYGSLGGGGPSKGPHRNASRWGPGSSQPVGKAKGALPATAGTQYGIEDAATSLAELGDDRALRALTSFMAGGSSKAGGPEAGYKFADDMRKAMSMRDGSGSDIFALRKTGPARNTSSGFAGGKAVPYTAPGPKQYNEFEQRGRDSRQRDFDRSQTKLDLALQQEFERRKRDDLIKQIMGIYRRGIGNQTETSTRTGSTQQITNVGGLPVRMPITSSESSSTTRPISFESILSLLR